VTCLLHESGESLESLYPLGEKSDAQAMGSALTYAKRYALSALIGIVTEDDDDGQSSTGKPVGPEQIRNLKAEMEKAGKSADDVKAICQKVAGHKNVRRLTPPQFAEVFKRLGERGLADAGNGRGGKK
jgi:hypothetical protein